MILGIGIDSVEIERFANWHTYSDAQLRRIFSEEEIQYCLSNAKLSAQRFAVRFAAREALFKAITQVMPKHTMPFLTLCSATIITKINEKTPHITLNWQLLVAYSTPQALRASTIHLSLTHTQITATSIIIISQ